MKTDLVQEFPGNNPSHIFYPFDILVFKLTPCSIPDQEKISKILI